MSTEPREFRRDAIRGAEFLAGTHRRFLLSFVGLGLGGGLLATGWVWWPLPILGAIVVGTIGGRALLACRMFVAQRQLQAAPRPVQDDE